MTDLRLAPRTGREVRVRAPGKVNLSLRVGPRRADGYHPVATVFQAVSVYEDVVATAADDISVSASGPQADLVPTDDQNLAVRAARALAARTGIADGVHLHLHKGVPVAGGMAGGSADAAAALLACDAFWGTGLPREELHEIAAELGADVPFLLMGQTAVGSGRGDLLTAAMSRGEYHWAFGVRESGLSTPAVYGEFDRLHPGRDRLEADGDVALLHALRAGDAPALGALLHNDLQDAAVELAPDLVETLSVAEDAGALGVVVSGSGPTVAALGRSRQHALVIAAAMTAAGVADSVLTASGPVPGARVVAGSDVL
ncbi:4-(cytidine 5'-diphospho)-2-C-methyl-D-erythritol kinase [Cellulomonas triticagri]|uniref:4-diphosphocytidyl-2-C-methyl-D-erythritol kinase n=1 Tax=Cellulomonas triticagri TaxID=2483352 RepID=A0A3M2JHD7_9CELL|nr:4-(cytidine 5'-diphospho)-2-C-methyl-D-erythritol kinase [Cellulomonas triticagri]RMI12454.1 4-(cytidine 5'-diphospho)-2-C-methyl-D-erythritol kinase [Cellulomonas triticagri]